MSTKLDLKVQKSFSIDIDVLRKLGVYAKVHRISLSEAAEQAIEVALKDAEKGVKIEG